MVDIVDELVHKLRLNDKELKILRQLLLKCDLSRLNIEEKAVRNLFLCRINGRLKIINKD